MARSLTAIPVPQLACSRPTARLINTSATARVLERLAGKATSCKLAARHQRLQLAQVQRPLRRPLPLQQLLPLQRLQPRQRRRQPRLLLQRLDLRLRREHRRHQGLARRQRLGRDVG